MPQQNICQFSDCREENNDLVIINFVLENGLEKPALICSTVTRVAFVVNGSAKITADERELTLSKDDVFFLLPSVPVRLDPGPGFSYMYLSFFGPRGDKITEELHVSRRGFVFPGLGELFPIWNEVIHSDSPGTNYRREGMLFYTFAALAGVRARQAGREKPVGIIHRVKKYIDENGIGQKITLDQLSREFSYSKKYISKQFVATFHIGISEYVNRLKIAYACTLIREGSTVVKDIAFRCGFSDPLYFSRVFTQGTGSTPTAYIEQNRKNE